MKTFIATAFVEIFTKGTFLYSSCGKEVKITCCYQMEFVWGKIVSKSPKKLKRIGMSAIIK